VFVPEYVVDRWWEGLLHNQSALRIKLRLLLVPNVVVTSVPYQLASPSRPDEPPAPSGAEAEPARGSLRPEDAALSGRP
jgi:hypothetical protein